MIYLMSRSITQGRRDGFTAQILLALSVNALIVVAGSIAPFLAIRPMWMRVQRYAMGGVLGALAVMLATDR